MAACVLNGLRKRLHYNSGVPEGGRDLLRPGALKKYLESSPSLGVMIGPPKEESVIVSPLLIRNDSLHG